MAFFYIHGWAATDKVWPESLKTTDSYFYHSSVYPDYGHLNNAFIEAWETARQPIAIVGWSLGGMLALRLAADHHDKIRSLVLVGSTARFTSCDDYAAGLAPAVVKNLVRKVARDKRQAQLDFYRLMFSKGEQGMAERFINETAPLLIGIEEAALQAGLDYLLETDLRGLLQDVKVPCRILHGTEDTICPVEVAYYLADNLYQAELYLVEGAGHIPFYTEPNSLQCCLKEVTDRND